MSVADKLQTIAENEAKVHEAGKQAQYDEFWTGYLAFAKSGGFGANLFAGRGWNDTTFNPPEKIDYVTNAVAMFTYCDNISKEKLATVDYSKMQRVDTLFAYSYIKELPQIDLSNVTTEPITNVFRYCRLLKSIDSIKLKDDGSQTLKYCFTDAIELENIRVEGVIGQNYFDWSSCTKLNKASIKSIIDHLSSTTSDLTVTLSKTAVNNAFGVMGEHSAEWMDLRDTKKNWTISLV